MVTSELTTSCPRLIILLQTLLPLNLLRLLNLLLYFVPLIPTVLFPCSLPVRLRRKRQLRLLRRGLRGAVGLPEEFSTVDTRVSDMFNQALDIRPPFLKRGGKEYGF